MCQTLCNYISQRNAHSFWWGLIALAQGNANGVNVDWIQTVNCQLPLPLIFQGHEINIVINNWSENNSNKLLACELNKILPVNLKIIDCKFISTEKVVSFELQIAVEYICCLLSWSRWKITMCGYVYMYIHIYKTFKIATP